jgi:hypothetical protein
MIDESLYKEIEKYCKLNEIQDVDGEINSMLRIGFNVSRYGTSPMDIAWRQKEQRPSVSLSQFTAEERDDAPQTQAVDTKTNRVVNQPQHKKKIRIIKAD